MAVRKDSSSEEDEEMILDEFVYNVVFTLSRILSLHLLSMNVCMVMDLILVMRANLDGLIKAA